MSNRLIHLSAECMDLVNGKLERTPVGICGIGKVNRHIPISLGEVKLKGGVCKRCLEVAEVMLQGVEVKYAYKG